MISRRALEVTTALLTGAFGATVARQAEERREERAQPGERGEGGEERGVEAERFKAVGEAGATGP